MTDEQDEHHYAPFSVDAPKLTEITDMKVYKDAFNDDDRVFK